MPLRAVTFDCANTLVRVDWRLDRLVEMAATRVGLAVGEGDVAGYLGLFRSRHSRYLAMNRTRSQAANREFWTELGADWLRIIGADPELLEPMLAAADDLLFGRDSIAFSEFEDVRPCLEALKDQGVRLAVISNWDISLRRTLTMFDLDGFFEVIVASLEEGVEKPDSRLFQLTLERLGLPPSEVLHVGDDPVDDFQGARNAGLSALLVNRNAPSTEGHILRTLRDLRV